MNYQQLSNEELDKLVMQRDGNAICEMADRNRKGSHGVLRNATRAFNLYHKAEKMNMPQAFQALGEMYAQGDCVAQNTDIANEYFRKLAMMQGNVQQEFGQIQDQSIEQEYQPTQLQEQNLQFDNEYEEQDTVAISNEFEDSDTEKEYEDTVVQFDNPLEKINVNEIKQLLDNGFNSRINQDYNKAKECAGKVLEILANVSVNAPAYEYKIDAFWLAAFTAFNEGDYMTQEQMSAQQGVSDKYPWSVYLLTVIHLNTNQVSQILESDMTKLLYYLNSGRLNQNEHSQYLSIIGDLYLRNIHSEDGDTMELAYSYFSASANEGNIYAKQQLDKFTKTRAGKIIYKG